MVVKKVVKRTTPVIVETKKHEEVSCCNHKGQKLFGILVIVLLLLNLAVWVWNSLNASSARNIEALKVWGKENLELVKKLYQMDNYKDQQKSAIMQVLSSFATDPQWQEIETAQELPLEAQTVTQ